MALIGIITDKHNPEFTKRQFVFWMPQFEKFFFSDTTTDPWTETEEGILYWNEIYPVVNGKVFESIFGSDWKLAMSYAIAHYLTLIAQQKQAPSGDSLSDIAGGGVIRGILSSASVGGFSKSYDIDKTVSSDEEAMWWNQTSYGAAYWALIKTKHVATIFIATSNPVPGSGNF